MSNDQRLLVGYWTRIGCVTGGPDAAVIRGVTDAERIHDADAWKERRAKSVDRRCAGLTGKRLWREGLSYGAVNLLAKNSEHFRNAQVRPEGLRIGQRRDLAAGIETLRKARNAGVSVGCDARIMLIIVFCRYGVLGASVPIEIGDGLIGGEVGGARADGVFRKSRVSCLADPTMESSIGH